jgi:predicted RNA binding protein YcfA (HicA-like mRNA interferase family)
VADIDFRKFEKWLRSKGCIHQNTEGSHHKYSKKGLNRPIIIVNSGGRITKRVLQSTLKDLQISKKDFDKDFFRK